MELYEKLEQEILNSITPELEAKFFLVAEFFKEGKPKGPVLGRITADGFGDTVLIYALHDERFPETKSFETAVEYYESQGVFKVYHLTEGLKVMFSHRMMPGCSKEDCPELNDILDEWWTAWCDYARQFYDEEEIRKDLLALANAFEQVLNKPNFN